MWCPSLMGFIPPSYIIVQNIHQDILFLGFIECGILRSTSIIQYLVKVLAQMSTLPKTALIFANESFKTHFTFLYSSIFLYMHSIYILQCMHVYHTTYVTWGLTGGNISSLRKATWIWWMNYIFSEHRYGWISKIVSEKFYTYSWTKICTFRAGLRHCLFIYSRSLLKFNSLNCVHCILLVIK